MGKCPCPPIRGIQVSSRQNIAYALWQLLERQNAVDIVYKDFDVSQDCLSYADNESSRCVNYKIVTQQMKKKHMSELLLFT